MSFILISFVELGFFDGTYVQRFRHSRLNAIVRVQKLRITAHFDDAARISTRLGRSGDLKSKITRFGEKVVR